MSARSVSDALLFERSAAGQTAPDGVAGDSACTDPAGLTGRNAGLGWEGHSSSTCYLLGFVLLSPYCFFFSFPQLRPRSNCHGWDQSPGGRWQAEERAKATSSHTPVPWCVFFLKTVKDVTKKKSASWIFRYVHLFGWEPNTTPSKQMKVATRLLNELSFFFLSCCLNLKNLHMLVFSLSESLSNKILMMLHRWR